MIPSDLNRFDRFVTQYCDENRFSMTLRLTQQDHILYERFVGMEDREQGIPLSNETLFSFYSLSKPFCAIALCKLADRGLVDLDAHPGRYLPEASVFDSRITLRQMLHHLSGLPDPGQDTDFPAKYPNDGPDMLRSRLAELAGYPLQNAPGEAGRYANINFTLPALIIENITGLNYGDFMQKEIFEPLEMKTARIDRAGLTAEHRARGYEQAEGTVRPIERSLFWMTGAGDILGRTDDVYRLNHAIKRRLLLKPETWEQILTPSPLNQMGMGCTVSTWHGKRRITHNGGHLGFRTLHIQLPEEDLDFILLSNCGWGNARQDISEKLYELCLKNASAATAGKTETVRMDTGYI